MRVVCRAGVNKEVEYFFKMGLRPKPRAGRTASCGAGPAGGWLGWNWVVWFGMVGVELGWFGKAIAVFQTAERGPRNSTHFRIILRLENAGPSVIQWTYAFRYSNSSVASSHGVRRGLPGGHSHAAQWSGGPGDLYGRHCSHRQDAGGRHRKNLRRDGHRHAAIHASGSNSFRDARAGPSPTRHDRRSRTEGARGVAAAHMKLTLALWLSALFLAGGLLAQKPIVEGRADSPVRAVIYEDLQCPDCAAFCRMMDEKLLPEYGGKVAFVHRDFPLAKHAWARRAAIAARFFTDRKPELGLEYRRYTMAGQEATNDANFNMRLADFAKAHDIEPDAAVAALSNARYAEVVEQDYQDGVSRGVVHTPTVFVNGKPFVETFTFEEISKGIDQALAEALAQAR